MSLLTVDRFILKTPPAEEPVSLTELKLHLRVDSADEDTLITALGIAARQALEERTRTTTVATTWYAKLDCFGGYGIQLLKMPLRSITSIKYNDAAGDEQTLSTDVYEFSLADFLPTITLKDGQSWPTTESARDAVTIEFVVGMAADAAGMLTNNMGARWQAAIKLLVAHWYENREETNTGQVTRKIPWDVMSLVSYDSRVET